MSSSVARSTESFTPKPVSDSPAPLYFIPRLSARQERLTRIVAVVAWGYGLYWVAWRWTSTINWDAPVFSLTLLVAETYGLISALLLVFTVWKINHRETPPAPDGLSVDVFITCYDEPLQLLRRTAIGAAAIRYPHRTWILDDGRRNEVRAMARELGIGYIRRKGNANAKAGNLNNALRHTRGEFILQLDADHVPLPNILDRMLGYFNDPKVAFIQSPQDFYNTTDSFTHVVNDEGRRLWEENRIFFSLIQPGKDTWNASFFCGSCGMLRRSAIEEIGGFSTLTITEDMETSILLHARGWKSVYHGETLAFGLAPASAGQYHVQRLRWGQGSMQILRKLNPLFKRGLTWPQRILYFASTITYLDGLQKLVFYLAPLVFLYTGEFPLRTTDGALLVRLIPFLALTVLSFEMLSRGTGWILISERYNMTKFFTYIVALGGFFTKKPLKFRVTPKGAGAVPWRTYAPQLTLAVLSAAAIPFALAAYHFGWVSYRVSGALSAAFALNAFWVAWNFYFAVFVVRHSILSRQRREDYRFLDSIPVNVRVVDDAGIEHRVGMTDELNSSGLSFRASFCLPEGVKVEIPLSLSTGLVLTAGTVVRVSEYRAGFGVVYTHGVRFDDLPIASRDAIEVHCTHHAVPVWQSRYRQSIHLLQHMAERFSDLRTSRRRPVSLPAFVRTSGVDTSTQTTMGLLEEMSTNGARLVMDAPMTPGSTIAFEVPGTSLKGEGVVVFNRAFESPGHVRFAVGLCSAHCPPSWWQRSFGRRPTLDPQPSTLIRTSSARRGTFA
jgi:cellulose synthase (UDP-forming)